MDAIAHEAGITKPILYRHFGDKGGLYRALADRYANALMTEISDSLAREDDARARLELTIDTYLAFLESEPQVYRFFVSRNEPEGGGHDAISALQRRVASEVAAVGRRDLDRFGLAHEAVEVWAYGVVGMVQLAGDWWLEHRTMTRAEVVEQLVTLLWNGMDSLIAEAGMADADIGRDG